MAYCLTKDQIIHAYDVAHSASGAAKLLGVKLDTYRKYAKMYDCYKTNQFGGKYSRNYLPYREDTNINIHYFDDINSNDKAYILGYLLADGSVSETSIKISIAVRDREFLEYICETLNIGIGRIRNFVRKYDYKGTCRKFYGSSLYINSKHVVKTLGTYGLVVNRVKNNFNLFEYIPDNMKFSCLVGYIDGNGSFSKVDKSISISSSSLTCNVISEYLKQFGVKICCIRDYDNFSKLCFYGDVDFLEKYLTANTFILSRKRLLAQAMLARIKNIGLRKIDQCENIGDSVENNPYINHCIDCGAIITNESIRCKSCAGKLKKSSMCKRPSRNELLHDLLCRNFLKLSEKYDVSDNAVRKWCKFYGLPYSTKQLKSMSDDELLNL